MNWIEHESRPYPTDRPVDFKNYVKVKGGRTYQISAEESVSIKNAIRKKGGSKTIRVGVMYLRKDEIVEVK